MSAKLACSARHISGFSDEKIDSDLRNYSPLFALVRVSHRGATTSAQLGRHLSALAHFDPLRGAQLIPGGRSKSEPPLPPSEQPAVHRHSLHHPPANQLKRERPQVSSSQHHPVQKIVERQLLSDTREGLDTRAVVVVCGDTVIAEAYGNGIGAETRLLGWSMTKSLLAMLWGRMETLGLAQPHESTLFSEWSQDKRSEITLENLLQMCDGLEFDESYRPGADVTRMLFGQMPASRYPLERPLKRAPGDYFSYSSGSTNLLAGWMRTRLGGTEAALKFFQREFLQPLELHSVLLETDADGVFIGSSYGYATARDWARLGSILLNNGRHRGEAVIDSGWVQRATTPNHSDNDPRYGYQLWLNTGGVMPQRYPTLPPDSYFMLGNREQKLIISPAHNAVIVRLGWSSAPYPADARFGEILDSLPE